MIAQLSFPDGVEYLAIDFDGHPKALGHFLQRSDFAHVALSCGVVPFASNEVESFLGLKSFVAGAFLRFAEDANLPATGRFRRLGRPLKLRDLAEEHVQ